MFYAKTEFRVLPHYILTLFVKCQRFEVLLFFNVFGRNRSTLNRIEATAHAGIYFFPALTSVHTTQNRGFLHVSRASVRM